MSYLKSLIKKSRENKKRIEKIKMRQHINADALFHSIRSGFENIQDHRQGNVKISLPDALMSGFAMFSLKDPSLLAFDRRRQHFPHSLKAVYGINQIPCDTSMREILDDLNPVDLRPSFKTIFQRVQHKKVKKFS